MERQKLPPGAIKMMMARQTQPGTSTASNSLNTAHVEDSANTGGISTSNHAFCLPHRLPLRAVRKKMMKRHSVKKSLQELKSLVSSSTPRTGTLSTLQTVIRRLKEGNLGPSPKLDRIESLPQNADVEGEFVPLGDDVFKIVVTLEDSKVVDVDESLVKLLDYPEKYWLNQPFVDFVGKEDHVSITSFMSVRQEIEGHAKHRGPYQEDERQPSCFFLRLRHFKGLGTGKFSLRRHQHSSVFRVNWEVQTLPDHQGYDSSRTKPVDSQRYLVFSCRRVLSAYTGENSVPAHNTFTTKHTVFLNLSYVDMKAVPMLGYLPHDLVGKSLFDLYHPDDLPYLQAVYKEVAARPGQQIQTQPYRFRVKNGSFVAIATVFTCQLNVWTQKIDCIVCQNRVVKQPAQPDVFAEPDTRWRHGDGDMALRHTKLIQHTISSFLQKACGDKSAAVGNDASNTIALPEGIKSTTESGFCEKDNLDKTESMASLLSAESFLQHVNKVTQEQQNPVLLANKAAEEEEKELANLNPDSFTYLYEQLSYAQSIKKYLCSWYQQRDHEEDSETAKDVQGTQKLHGRSQGSESFKSLPLDVDISPLPKPPSFASSTKPLISDHEEEEQEELMPTSPAQGDGAEEQQCTKEQSACEDATVTLQVPLTSENLKLHNQLAEKSYMQELIKEKGALLSTLRQRYVHQGKRSHGKREMAADEQYQPKCKFQRKDGGPGPPSRMLMPRLQVTRVDVKSLQAQTAQEMDVAHDQQEPVVTVTTGCMDSPVGAAIQHDPTVTASAMGGASRYRPILPATMASGNIQWPYYRHNDNLAAFTFEPNMMSNLCQVMPGIYQPVPGNIFGGPSVAMAAEIRSSSHNSSAYSLPQKENTRERLPTMERVPFNTSSDTSSSMYYLLDTNPSSDSHIHLNMMKPKMKKRMKRSVQKVPNDRSPQWIKEARWTANAQLRLRMPKPNQAKVLKADRQMLRDVMQPEDVIDQMADLLMETACDPGPVMLPEDEDGVSITYLPAPGSEAQEQPSDKQVSHKVHSGQDPAASSTDTSGSDSSQEAKGAFKTLHKQPHQVVKPTVMDTEFMDIEGVPQEPDKPPDSLEKGNLEEGCIDFMSIDSTSPAKPNSSFSSSTELVEKPSLVPDYDNSQSSGQEGFPQGDPIGSIPSPTKNIEATDLTETDLNVSLGTPESSSGSDDKSGPKSLSSEGCGSADKEVAAIAGEESEKVAVQTLKGDKKGDSDSNTSEKSSNLTPSDQRSSEEVGSSLKESDNQSSHSGGSNSKKEVMSSESDMDPMMNRPLPVIDSIFRSLFVNMAFGIEIPESRASPTPAPSVTALSSGGQMQEKLAEASSIPALQMSIQNQPDLVKEQLMELLQQLEESQKPLRTHQKNKIKTPVCGSDHHDRDGKGAAKAARDFKVQQKMTASESKERSSGMGSSGSSGESGKKMSSGDSCGISSSSGLGTSKSVGSSWDRDSNQPESMISGLYSSNDPSSSEQLMNLAKDPQASPESGIDDFDHCKQHIPEKVTCQHNDSDVSSENIEDFMMKLE